AAAELLDDQAVGQRVRAAAAVLLGDREPDPAAPRKPIEPLLREALLAVVADRGGDDDGVDPLRDGTPGGLLLRRECQVHRCPPRARGCGPAAPAARPTAGQDRNARRRREAAPSSSTRHRAVTRRPQP